MLHDVFFYVQRFEMRGDCFVDIGAIVDHSCLNFLFTDIYR